MAMSEYLDNMGLDTRRMTAGRVNELGFLVSKLRRDDASEAKVRLALGQVGLPKRDVDKVVRAMAKASQGNGWKE
jgi:hypothetical protein